MDEKHTLDRRQFLKATAGAAAAAVAATPLIQALPAAAQEMMYSQAPMLDDMGLPPVEERLPSNPRVIPVFEEIGEHGGTWRRGFKGRADMQGPAKLFYAFGLHFQYTADLSSVIIVPGLYDEWSQNDDSTEYTFHMREGMKWSDGHPFTTTDVQFWYDWYQNGEIGATRSVLNVGGQNLDLEIVDEETFICRLGQPSPLLPFKVARDDTEGQHGGPTMAAPVHYLSQFVQDHENANQEMIDAAMAANEVPTWQELFGTGGTPRGPISWWATNPDVPVVQAWWMEKPLPFNDPIVLVRNPYFYSVDETGQQLPYVDRIEHKLFEDSCRVRPVDHPGADRHAGAARQCGQLLALQGAGGGGRLPRVAVEGCHHQCLSSQHQQRRPAQTRHLQRPAFPRGPVDRDRPECHQRTDLRRSAGTAPGQPGLGLAGLQRRTGEALDGTRPREGHGPA